MPLGPQVKHLEQAQQIIGQQRLGQRRHHVETSVMQQAPGTVDQGLIVRRQQYDGQAALLVLGLTHQQADGILLHQTEIADEQCDLPFRQRLGTGIAILHPLTGEPHPLDLLLNMSALKRVILQQQDLHPGQPLLPLLVTAMHASQPVIREPIDALTLRHQLRQIIGASVRGRVKQGDGTGGKQPLPVPAGIGPGTAQDRKFGQADRLGRPIGDPIQRIDGHGVEETLLCLFRIQQRQ